jgi:hypothetical protein
MIKETVKAKAIAQIKRSIPLDQIAEELSLPVMLLEDWAKLEGKDLVAMEANLHAVETILNRQEVVEQDTVEILKTKLEEAALEVTKDIPMAMGDVVYAKSLQLCADTISKLYVHIVNKGIPADTGIMNLNGDSAFAQLQRD